MQEIVKAILIAICAALLIGVLGTVFACPMAWIEYRMSLGGIVRSDAYQLLWYLALGVGVVAGFGSWFIERNPDPLHQ